MSRKSVSDRKWQIPEKYQLFLMLFPFLVLVFIFSYLPLSGWRYAFYLYRPGFALKDCEYVGLYWFQSIVSNSYQIKEISRVMVNTLAISGLGLLLNCFAPIFAVLLNEIRHKRYRKTVQVLTTLPNFISWVLVYAVAFALFNVDAGLINKILLGIGLIDKPINFLASDKNVWLTMTLWSAWKSLGWSGILYLAAIAGIDQEQYEAARLDGATRWQQMWYITLPGIIPTISICLIMALGGILGANTDLIMNLYHAGNAKVSEVIGVYIYRMGLGFDGATTIPRYSASADRKSVV